MPYTIEKLPKSLIQISYSVPPEEVEPFLEPAAKDISKELKLDGFRPGHVPYDVIKQKVGEAAIWEQALERIVKKKYFEAVMQEKLETIGSPKINVEKVAPGNPIEFKITIALVPEITKLADYKAKKLQRKDVQINDEKIDKAIKDLSRMQTKEKLVDRPATKADKIILDLEITKDGVVIEGGKSPDFQVYLSEENYIPGLCDNLVGLKKGDEKTFSLAFPDEHYQKHLAGKKADFKIKVTDVFELEPPQINDEFAKSLGQENLAKLKEAIRNNLKQESEKKEEAKLEHEMFEGLIKDSDFADIPDQLINEEVHKMIHELEHSVAQQELEFDQYLNQIKKTMDQLKLDMAPEAIRRIKAALLIRKISTNENIEVSDKEIDQELDRQAKDFKPEDEKRKQIYSPEYRDYMTTLLTNRKTIQLIKENMVK